MTTPIPTPPAVPFIGHVTTIERETPLLSFDLLADQYGEIFQLHILGRNPILVNTVALQRELSDDKRFYKVVTSGTAQVRNAIGDGLFTAFKDEPNWGIAHRLLMPAFGAASIRGMFSDMVDIASQLVLKWERFGPRHSIDIPDDFTRLTFDVIALCSMSYRLNSFYRDNSHPFIAALSDFLTESGIRANRPNIVNNLMSGKYVEDIKTMADLADSLIQERKLNPSEKGDLLDTMLFSKDPKTGEGLSDECIRNNLLTFMIAGHETTSGLLSFSIYYLIKNPEAMRKAQEEVDEVLGDQEIQLGDISKLKYITAILRESLRLQPPAAMRTVAPFEDTTIGGGKYFVKKGQTVALNAHYIHRDPAVYGDDAQEFKPERMLDHNFEALPQNAWQPFGYGMRACIGRPFAMQEAQIVLAMILQKFDFAFSDPSYTLELKQTLTIKPKHFFAHALPRHSKKPRLLATPSATSFAANRDQLRNTAHADVSKNAHPMYVLYGSNTGTSQGFAQRIADDAAKYGFRATLGTLDSAVDHVPSDGPVVVVCASFEGEPADNAAHFVHWLESLKGQELANASYAVFGCGNKEWVSTYQRIPKLVDRVFAERGAKRLVQRGEGDAAHAEFFESFDAWETKLWEALPKEYKTVVSEAKLPGLEVTNVTEGATRANELRHADAALGSVVENRLLTPEGPREKRHIEFVLPEGQAARAGDYLAILPTNPPRDVHRAISRFNLLAEQEVVLSSTGPSSLPVGKAVTISTLLSGYVELSQPATTRDIRSLLEVQAPEETRKALETLQNAHAELVVAKRLSLLDILEEHPDLQISFGAFLSMLPTMRVRQYSISSSPLWNAQHVTLTVSVLQATPISGRKEPFLGVASNFLASLRPGDKVQMAVRPSNASFHLPQDPKTPLVLFAAGSGLAPMRGFLQERALQKKAGRQVGEAFLFFGCRNPKEDFLYSDSDLKVWEELGAVKVRPAFSRAAEESLGCKYVQDRVWHDRKELAEIYDQGARYYVCGSSKVARAIKETLTAIIKDATGCDEQEAAAKFERAVVGRFAADIFE